MYNLDVDIVSFDGVDCFEIMSIETRMLGEDETKCARLKKYNDERHHI